MGKSPMQTNWWDRFLIGVAPKWGMQRVRSKFELRSYEAAGTGRRTTNWQRSSSDANKAASGALIPLRELSRDLRRNNAWARRGIQVISSTTVGWGIQAKASGVSGVLAKDSLRIWNEWSRNTNCDFDGRMPFSGLQRLAMDCITESGEVLILKVSAKSSDGLPVPLRIRVLEPDFIDTRKHGKVISGYIDQGIEFDGNGRRVAYWIHQQHPGSDGLYRTGIESKRIPATDILHVYRVDRAGQMRGVPWLAAAIARLNDFGDYEDAKLMQQKVAALFAAFVSDMDGQGSALGEQDEYDDRIESMEPGQIEYLKPGQEISFPSPPSISDHGSFSQTTLRGIAAALGITYEDLTGDYSQVNFSSARMARIAYYANVHSWRWEMLIPQMCKGVWGWVMEYAAEINGWEKIPDSEWSPPPMPMISPEKEGLAYTRLIRGGMMTLQQAIRERGEDPESHIAEIAESNKILDANNIILDSDPRHTSSSGGSQNPKNGSPE